MPDAVIVAAARTPIGRANKGSLVDVDAFVLAETAIAAVLARARVDPADIDDLVLAESLQGGGVIGRYVAVRLGLPHVPGLADNRHCAAGLSAVQIAAGSILAGMDSVVIAGGTESLSSMPQTFKSIPASARDYKPWRSASHPEQADAPAWDISITVGENTAREAGVSRQAADEWAVMSHLRAAASIDNGWFVPVMITSADYASDHNLEVLGRVRSWANVGVDPARTGMAPVTAIPKALDRAGIKVSDLACVEVNEAFTPVAVAAQRLLGIDLDRINRNGSGCGLGHPIAATGARMVVTMLYELARSGGGLGCVSMCAGGGMGSALVLEV